MAVTRKARSRKRDRIYRHLVRSYPSVFQKFKPRPLAIGVGEELTKKHPELDVRDIQKFLGWWCHRLRYLEAVATSKAYRHHLDGKRSSPVSASDRVNAMQMHRVIVNSLKKKKQVEVRRRKRKR